MKKTVIFTMLCSFLFAVCVALPTNAAEIQPEMYSYYDNIDIPVYYDLNCDGTVDSLAMDMYSNYYGCYSMVINGQTFAFDIVRHGHHSYFFVTDIDETDGFLDIVLIGEYKGVWMSIFRYDGARLYQLADDLIITTERDYEIYTAYLAQMKVDTGNGKLTVTCGPETFTYSDFSNFEPVEITEEKIREAFNEQEGGIYFVSLNGQKVAFDQPPVNKKDRILVPIRAIFEEMGYILYWDGETRTAHAIKENNIISIQIGNKMIFYTIDGVSGVYECDVAPQIVTGRTLIPLRGIAESAGCLVEWDETSNTVEIISR